MTGYLEMLFILNVVIDFVLLSLTAWICHQKVEKRNILYAAIIGATFVVIYIYGVSISWIGSLISIGIIATVMIWIVFSFSNIQQFFRLLGVFMMVSFMLAGCMYAIYSSAVSQAFNYTIWLFIIGFIGFIWLVFTVQRSIKQKQRLFVSTTLIRIQIDEVTFECRGLIDTGNQLRDPITKTPVTIIQLDQWQPWLPHMIVEMIQSRDLRTFQDSPSLAEFRWRHRIQFIPFRTMTQEQHSYMFAIRADQVDVQLQGEWIRTSRPLLAIVATTLNRDSLYQAVIHPDLILS